MYGVLAYFDENTEKFLKGIWKGLVYNSISYYSEEVKDRRPHITIADYNNIEENEFIESMDNYYDIKSKIDVRLSVLGTFLNSGALFISPTMSKELIGFHNSHHENFKRFNDDLDSLYLPGKWIPHCTIANRLTQDKLVEAFNYCTKNIDTIHAKISEVALIKVINEEDKGSKVVTVFSKELK